MNLVTSGTSGKQILICEPAEFKTVDSKIDKILEVLSTNLAFFEQVGLYDQAYELFDKLESLAVREEEARVNDGGY